jgi:hypothetical protein
MCVGEREKIKKDEGKNNIFFAFAINQATLFFLPTPPISISDKRGTLKGSNILSP